MRRSFLAMALVACLAFTASAGADIDANSAYQTWGYKKGGVTAKTLGNAGVCAIANLQVETVGPCATNYGQSVF